jgi:PTH2 family peptidyl-tRNA hydrolase
MEAKQVIVLRKDLGMRKGKMIAQGAHASMAVILNMLEWSDLGQEHGSDFKGVYECSTSFDSANLSDLAVFSWLREKFAKISLYVNSEEELLELYEKAKAAKLPCSLIQDAGRTEFKGVPTYTAIAIGPCWPSEVDPITGHLKLL